MKRNKRKSEKREEEERATKGLDGHTKIKKGTSAD